MGAEGAAAAPTPMARMIDTVLKTERLLLRPLAPEDAPALLRYAQDNRVWLEPWEPARHESYYTQEAQRSILYQNLEDRRAGTGVLFGIYERSDRQRIQGRISLSGIVRGIWQNGFVGYSISEARAGRGYMTEALQRVVLFGFADLALHRIQASILPRNQASLRVAAKCRFRHEGRGLRYMEINNIWEDHDIYAITVEEIRDGYP
jgi:ribosomal-protein-alanine N-acetyltransferase